MPGGRESILAELVSLRTGARLPEACPEVDAQGARLAARVGTPLSTVLYLYRVGHSVQWGAWFELVEAEEPDPDARRALLQRGSRFFFDYADRLSRFVTDEYTQERDRLLRSQEQRRVHLVRELLAGQDVDASPLDYDVDARHVGLVAWGPQAAEATRELARRLDRRALLVGVGVDSWWVWLGSGRALGARAAQAVEGYRPPPGARLAIGEEAAGREGFGRTHAQARVAHRAAAAGDAAITLYDDVALESLVSRDEPEARAFVARELEGIDGDDPRSRRLRDTLAAYFATGQNAASAAARLGVHERTIANRLDVVVEGLARSVGRRRAELEAARRLRAWLASANGGEGSRVA